MASISETKLGTLGNGNYELGIGFNFIGGKIYIGMSVLSLLDIILEHDRKNIGNSNNIIVHKVRNETILKMGDTLIGNVYEVNRFVCKFELYNCNIEDFVAQLKLPYGIHRKKIIIDINIDGYTTGLSFNESNKSVIIEAVKSKSQNMIKANAPARLTNQIFNDTEEREKFKLKLIKETSQEHILSVKSKVIQENKEYEERKRRRQAIEKEMEERNRANSLQEYNRLKEELEQIIKDCDYMIKEGYIYRDKIRTKQCNFEQIWKLDKSKDTSEYREVVTYGRTIRDCMGSIKEVDSDSRHGYVTGTRRQWYADKKFKQAEKKFEYIDRLQRRILKIKAELNIV